MRTNAEVRVALLIALELSTSSPPAFSPACLGLARQKKKRSSAESGEIRFAKVKVTRALFDIRDTHSHNLRKRWDEGVRVHLHPGSVPRREKQRSSPAPTLSIKIDLRNYGRLSPYRAHRSRTVLSVPSEFFANTSSLADQVPVAGNFTPPPPRGQRSIGRGGRATKVRLTRSESPVLLFYHLNALLLSASVYTRPTRTHKYL